MAAIKQILAGKTALITGAADGIGAATASLLAKKGANVIITYSKSKDKALTLAQTLASTYGIKAEALRLDMNTSNMDECIQTFMRQLENYNIDYLVNNAAVLKPDPTENIEAVFNEMMNVNYKGPWFLTSAIIKHMKAKGIHGSIINVSSVSDTVSFRGFSFSIYETTKAALTRMTTSIAADLAASNININTVAPGFVDTPMQQSAKSSPALWKRIENAALSKRVANSEEIATLIYRLMCKSNNQTAARIVSDGGLTMGYNLPSPQ